MKKIIIMMVIALMATTNVSAQNAFEPKHDIAISVGAWSNSDIINVFEDMLTIMLTGSNIETSSYFGPISLEYFYHLNRTISVGAIAAYGHMKQNFYYDKDKKNKDGSLTNNYFTLLPAVKFDWLQKKNFGLYSKLGLGATLRSEKIEFTSDSKKGETNSKVHVNWQISLLGVEAGAEKIRGFIELGTGEQGIALIGVRYKFQ